MNLAMSRHCPGRRAVRGISRRCSARMASWNCLPALSRWRAVRPYRFTSGRSVAHIINLPTPVRPRDTLGRPLHDLRISVMDRCNFRCPYCMPKETFHEHYRFLKSSERLSFEEITRVTRLFVQLGVKKVRLTGGEPLLRPNLSELVAELCGIDGVQDI